MVIEAYKDYKRPIFALEILISAKYHVLSRSSIKVDQFLTLLYCYLRATRVAKAAKVWSFSRFWVGVGTSCLKLESTIGPLKNSGAPPLRSSGELIFSGYPVQVFIEKSALEKFQF